MSDSVEISDTSVALIVLENEINKLENEEKLLTESIRLLTIKRNTVAKLKNDILANMKRIQQPYTDTYERILG